MRQDSPREGSTFTLTNKEITLLFAGAAVVVLLVFVVGVAVGRKMTTDTVASAGTAPPVETMPKDLTPGATGKWTVQIAASTERKQAVDLAKKLGVAGYPSYVVTADVGGKTYHRVRVGRFTSREAAEEYKNMMLREKAVDAGWVTHND